MKLDLPGSQWRLSVNQNGGWVPVYQDGLVAMVVIVAALLACECVVVCECECGDV